MSTDNTSQDDGQVRVAKRTYGRSRAPAAEDDAPSTSMVFDGVAVAGSLASGALVDRWSKQNTNWRETLADLDAGTEQEETEDEIKAIASRLRHGEEDDTSAVKVAHRVPQPANRLVAASSLTILPPSSSPTRAVRSLAEEEQLRSSPPAPRDLPGTQQSVLDQGGVPLDDMSGFAPDELQQSDVLPGRVEFEDAEESRNAHTRRGTPTDLPVKGDTNLELSRSLFSDEVESPLPSERSNSRALKVRK